MTAAETAALRALRDCGAISAPADSAFGSLRRMGLAFTAPVPGTDRRVFTLSEHGRTAASYLPRAGFNPKFGG